MTADNNRKMIGTMLVAVSLILIFLIAFVKMDVDVKDAFLCEKVHVLPELNGTVCPVHTSPVSWLLVAAFGAGFLILGGGLYIIFGQRAPEATAFREIDVGTLDEDERTIYTLLKNREGSMYQSDLIRETGMSKVQMTRVLDKMAGKKIVDRARRGMTNIVVLK